MKIRSIHEMTRYMTAIFVILILLTNIAAAETFATKEETLIHAASHGALGAVKNFLDSGADANALDKSGKTALMYAADNGHMEVLKLLVQRGADVNAADGEGRTALMSASSKGGLEETKYLLDSAGNVNTRDNIGVTALILAAENGHADLVNLLLDKGADLKAKDNSGWTALMCAADRGHANVVGLLKAKGAEVTLPVAALIGDRPEVEHFIEAGSDINMSVADGLTALIAAALRGNTSLVDLLLKKGADVNARAGGGPISRQKKSLVVPKGLPDSSPASRVVLTRGHVVNTMSKRLALKGSPILKIGGPRQGPHCRCIDPFRGLASRVPRDYRWVAPLGLVSVYSLSPPWEVGTIALTKLAT